MTPFAATLSCIASRIWDKSWMSRYNFFNLSTSDSFVLCKNSEPLEYKEQIGSPCGRGSVGRHLQSVLSCLRHDIKLLAGVFALECAECRQKHSSEAFLFLLRCCTQGRLHRPFSTGKLTTARMDRSRAEPQACTYMENTNKSVSVELTVRHAVLNLSPEDLKFCRTPSFGLIS